MSTVLFDLDGTLVDSVPGLTAVLTVLLEEEGRQQLPEAQVRGYLGHGAAHLLACAARDTGGPFSNDPLERYVALCRTEAAIARTRPYPGIPELLRTLPGGLGLVTNKPESATHALLEALGWTDRFDVVLGGDSLPTRKPHPAPLLRAMGVLEARPEETVYVGDSGVDRDAAAAAGVAFVGVAWGYGAPGQDAVTSAGALARRLGA